MLTTWSNGPGRTHTASGGRAFSRTSAEPGFCHETYFRRGGFEAIYDDMVQPVGLMAFAPVLPARAPMFGAAARARRQDIGEPVLSEKDLYGNTG